MPIIALCSDAGGTKCLILISVWICTMLVALTGTPGTGKTTVGGLLSHNGFRVIHLTDIEKKCIVGKDTKRDCEIYDIHLMNQYLTQEAAKEKNDLCIVEGHLSHLLSYVSKIIILRCHPRQLKKRLQKKGYRSLKIHENLEAEALDVILCDAVCIHGEANIREIDTTHKKPLEIACLISALLHEGFQGETGYIDWSCWIEKNVG
jgi:adenylate kinase